MSSKGRNSNKRPQRWGSNSSLGPTVGGSRPSSPAVSQSHLSNGQSPAPSQPKPNASEVAEVNKHMHDRLIFLIVSLVGTKVVATLKGGAKLEGILSSATTEGELGICLKLPMDLSQPESTLPRTMLIFGKDLQEITSADVDLEEKADEPKMAEKGEGTPKVV
ncbi:hypothetical protein BT69DRAFT_1344388 [Atractiella rhizophila]|nr:hypothetical protein BT69DRAFT_1344388 [Atractiella rhizophila]